MKQEKPLINFPVSCSSILNFFDAKAHDFCFPISAMKLEICFKIAAVFPAVLILLGSSACSLSKSTEDQDAAAGQRHAPLIAFTGNERGSLAGADSPVEKQPDTQDAISFEKPPAIPDMIDGTYQPPTPEQLGEQLQGAGSRWLYGPGFGRTVTNVATAVIFPPYAIYLLGNAGLALAGYKPLYVTDALPNPAKEHIISAYDGVTSVPGRITSFVAGREYYEGKEAEDSQEVEMTPQRR